MHLLYLLPEEIMKMIYIYVFNEVILELNKFSKNRKRIGLTVKRCNYRINNKRCRKRLRTRFLIGNYCSYHHNNNKHNMDII